MAIKRYEFKDIFQEHTDGTLELIQSIEVGQVIYPVATRFQKGVVYGGIDFHIYKNRAIAIESDENSEGPLKVIGFFNV